MASVVRIVPKSTAGVTSANRVTADYLHSTMVLNSTGVTMAPGLVVYAQQSDCGCYCEIYPADPRFNSKSAVLGIVVSTVFTGKTTRVAVGGTVPVLLEPGQLMPDGGVTMYLSSSAPGHITPAVPGNGAAVIELGTIAAGKLVINISKVLTAGEVGGGGLQLDLDAGAGDGGGLVLDL